MTHFSVLISIYCKENPSWFHAALNSVFAQTVLPSEIVLVEGWTTYTRVVCGY